MFAALNTGLLETARFIKSVTYHLQSTVTNSAVIVTEPPFMLERLGWEEFEVRMVIEFQPWTGMGPRELYHMLGFKGGGTQRCFLLEVDGTKEDIA